MVNRNILPGRGDPNPNPAQLDGFAPEQSSTASFRKSLMKRSEYEANRDAKGARLRDHLVAASGEFVGTVLFLYFAFAWQLIAISQQNAAGAGGTPSSEQVMYIAVGYGFSLLVNAWAFYRISGGLFNPAVVLGMVLSGTLPPVRGLWLFLAEILGCLVAAGLVDCMFPGDICNVNTTLSNDTSIAQGVFIEMFLTFILIFTILMLAAEKTKVTFMAPLGIGLSLFVAELAGVFYTGGSLNPARSFGPAVACHHFPGYHWIYWVGPFMGSLFCAGYFRFVKWANYEESNPGQDSAGGEFKD